MNSLGVLWSRCHLLNTQSRTQRSGRKTRLGFDRYGMDQLEPRQLLSVTPPFEGASTIGSGPGNVPAVLLGAAALASPAALPLVVGPTAANVAFTPQPERALPTATFPPVAVLQASGVTADDFSFSLAPDGVVITGYHGDASHVVIPDAIDGRPVVAIGADAFNTRRHVESVVLPVTVNSIGPAAFANCTNLRSITLPENVSAIGFNAFQYCLSLTSITLPVGLSQIGPVVFFGSSNLEAINVDEGNAYFASVEGVLYDKSLTTLIECPQGKTGTVVLPDTVTSIGRPGLDMVFAECGKLSVIVIPDSVTAIVDRAFENCSAVLVTTGASPFAPGRPSGVRGNGSVQLSWTAPASTGGLPVKDYRIQHSTNGGVTWQTVSRPASTATTATVTGLINGRGYRFRVACVTNAGVRPYSTASAVIVPAATPGMPVAVNAVRGNGSVQLSWTAPAPNGSKPITNYIIQHSRDGGRTWVTFNRPASTATTATVTGLTNGVGYVFRVSAVNATGVGLPSPLSNVVVPCTVPGAPSRLTAMPGTGSATLTWAAPTTNGGAPIINYVVQHSVDGGRSWVTVNRPASTATTATVPGLARGATYVFRVSAVNAAGIGTASPVSNVITIRA